MERVAAQPLALYYLRFQIGDKKKKVLNCMTGRLPRVLTCDLFFLVCITNVFVSFGNMSANVIVYENTSSAAKLLQVICILQAGRQTKEQRRNPYRKT